MLIPNIIVYDIARMNMLTQKVDLDTVPERISAPIITITVVNRNANKYRIRCKHWFRFLIFCSSCLSLYALNRRFANFILDLMPMIAAIAIMIIEIGIHTIKVIY